MVKGQRSASKFSCAAVRRLRGGAEKGTEGGLTPQYRVNNRLKVRRTLLLLASAGGVKRLLLATLVSVGDLFHHNIGGGFGLV